MTSVNEPGSAAAPPPSGAAGRWRRRGRRALGAVAGLALGVLGCRTLWFSGPYRDRQPAPPQGIVDLHAHVAGTGAGGSGCFVNAAMRDSMKFGLYLQAFGVTRAELEAKGDGRITDLLSERVAASGRIRAAVVLALDGVVDAEGRLDRVATQVYVPNEYVAEEVARHTNLLFGASINPGRRDALERLDWAADHGAVLVKWIPPIMGIDPADPRHTAFYQRLAERGLPLLSHTGQERSFTSSRDELGDPERLRLPLRLGVTVIAGHVGAAGQNSGEENFERLVRMMAEFPNLHADISALTQLNRPGSLEQALKRPGLAGRLVYGSDYPLINTALVSPWYFPLNLERGEMARLAALENPWQRDVELKAALGVPTAIFEQGAALVERRPRNRRN
jgi:predicted TIM-barrel fold metal-dependent hydrolase